MAQLNVNIDHVATVRQARLAEEPDPVWAAAECELGGASGITMHLREDRRHIQDRDVELVRQVSGVKFNLEMALTESMVRIARKLKPDMITLVPEKREELTTEGGLDCVKLQKRLTTVTQSMHKLGIVVSAFIIPAEDQIRACQEAGSNAIELHTGMYANARTERSRTTQLRKLEKGRDIGLDCGMTVHAGHGLTYRNIGSVAALAGLSDFNIGHSIIARSVFIGIRQATREMIELIDKFSP